MVTLLDEHPDDNAILAEILRRFLRSDGRDYFFVGDEDITIDATVAISTAEHEVLLRACEP